MNPSVAKIDFDAELCRAIGREAYAVSSHHRNTNILDWSNIYYYQVKPWTDKAEDLSTPQLMRLVSGEVSFGMFYVMIKANLDHKGGEWMCRKIDFVENKGLLEEAWQLAENNIKYPQVAIKLYLTLINGKNWDAALKLLDRVIEISNDKEYREYSYGYRVDWMEQKQKLLREHGTKEEQIKNLRTLFLNSYSDKEKYYEELKVLVDPSEWGQFYKSLFSEKSDSEILNNMAQFLAEEGELEWLFRLMNEHWDITPTDYNMLLKTAPMLSPKFESVSKEMLLRSFKASAAS